MKYIQSINRMNNNRVNIRNIAEKFLASLTHFQKSKQMTKQNFLEVLLGLVVDSFTTPGIVNKQ